MNDASRSRAGSSRSRSAPRRIYLLISILIGLTATRAFAMAFIPKLAMCGGAAPDEWVGPWVADSVLGMLIPVVLIAFYRFRTVRVWGLILLYNGLGAFDYSIGLVTQWQTPLPPSIAPTWLVFVSLSITLTAQLVVIALLLRRDVVHRFAGEP